MNTKINKIALTVFFTLLGLWVLLFATFSIIKSKEGIPSKISYTASVRDLAVCKVSYSSQGSPISITICGYIETEDPAWLSIYIFKLPDKQYISENQPEDFFNKGDFTRELSVNGFGNYLVEIWLFRNLISSSEFEIKPH